MTMCNISLFSYNARVAQKVSQYQIIQNCVKLYQSLPIRLDFFAKLKK